MAKTYLSAVKYEILASYEVQGVVEKPDIVGAIFGQCEGLLGEDMDLKELQQSGKIGRIEISVNKGKGTTSGEIIIPSSLDQIKTSILGATIETVEKVGPFECKVKVLKISDTRKEKRDVITDRAKELLKRMQKFEGIESGEMANTVKEEIRTEKIVEYNGLQAGPEVATNPEIIVVEGRADVMKLLSYGINNAVAMNGGNIDPPLIGLCKQKKVTVLIDGDRGGELNVKKLASMTKVDFVAKAPDGKEVEELTQKEILLSLKRREPYSDAFKPRENGFEPRQGFEPRPFQQRDNYRPRNDFSPRERSFEPRPFQQREGFRPRNNFSPRPFGQRDNYRPRFEQRGDYRPRFEPRNQMQENGYNQTPFQHAAKPEIMPEEVEKQRKNFEKLKGKSKARILDAKGKKIKELAVKDLLETVQKSKKKIDTIMFDGIITNRLVEAAAEKGATKIIGVKKGNLTPSQSVKTYTM